MESMTMKEVWHTIEQEANTHPAYIQELNAIYSIHLKGDDVQIYRVIFKEGTMAVEETEALDADCSLTLSVSNFKKLLQGNLNTTSAFMTGKLKVKGDIGLALKLEQTLKKFSF